MALTKVDISMMLNTGTTANKLLVNDGSGNLPAVDGSQLTNVATGILESTSDPVITTNPSGGVGTQWNNKTSGEVYICTDATAGANVWTNIGEGSGDIVPWVFGGTQYGFAAGDYNDPSISRFSFTSDGNAIDWGDLYGTSTQMQNMSGNSDKNNSYAYCCGGSAGGAAGNEIARFSMVSSGGSTDVGDMSQNTAVASSADTPTHGFQLGHEWAGGGGGDGDRISRLAFASSNNATDWANLMIGQSGAVGGCTDNDAAYGYVIAGYEGPPNAISDRIQKASLVSQTTATDIANTSVARHNVSNEGSATHGYAAAGWNMQNIIDKFPFASETNSTDVGDLTGARHQCTGVSSTTHGYAVGGIAGGHTDTMDKWSFTTDGNSTDIGNLSFGQITPATASI